jgi:hypothetical protein
MGGAEREGRLPRGRRCGSAGRVGHGRRRGSASGAKLGDVTAQMYDSYESGHRWRRRPDEKGFRVNLGRLPGTTLFLDWNYQWSRRPGGGHARLFLWTRVFM